DVAPIHREFDYVVPEAMSADVRLGTMVRVVLNGRRVGGWVVGDQVSPPPGIALQPLAKVTGWGPSAAVVALTEWAAWRWAGPRAALLKSASPDFAVRGLPPRLSLAQPVPEPTDDGFFRAAFASGRAIVRWP